MLVIGLTGGIGTGKSEVARLLAQLGATVLDADKVAHQVYAPHTETWQRIVAEFGRQVLDADGNVDRKKLGDIVFGDPARLARLNAITHPAVIEEVRERLLALERDGVEVVVVEALRLDTGLSDLVDEVWVTAADESQVVARVEARSGLTANEVRRRMASQPSADAFARTADVVVENRGSLTELKERIEALWKSRVEGRKR